MEPTPPAQPPTNPAWARWLVGAWAACLLGGTLAFGLYEHRSGSDQLAPDAWPEDLPWPGTDSGQHVAWLFVHPKCPCSRASLAEWDRILLAAGHGLRGEVVWVVPDGAATGWGDDDDAGLRAECDGRGLTVRRDPGGALAGRFGAATSGHAVWYGPDRTLRGCGGVTPSRGHRGPTGLGTAMTALGGRGEAPQADRVGPAATAVVGPSFGCPLCAAPDGCEEPSAPGVSESCPPGPVGSPIPSEPAGPSGEGVRGGVASPHLPSDPADGSVRPTGRDDPRTP